MLYLNDIILYLVELEVTPVAHYQWKYQCGHIYGSDWFTSELQSSKTLRDNKRTVTTSLVVHTSFRKVRLGCQPH